MDRLIIYQVLPRLFGNKCQTRRPGGTIEENGCGKMADFTPAVLRQLRRDGYTHVWYTGIPRHATTTDYTRYGIPRQHPAVVKGRAGSPYAIADYYDVDPDVATDVAHRMHEFEQLVSRTHRAGLKVIIDFVPNHVARQYHSICLPPGERDLGADDDPTQGFCPSRNNFYYCTGQPFTPYFDLYHGEQQPYTEMPARATGNDCFSSSPGLNDWYETVKLCYGIDYYAGGRRCFDPMPATWTRMLNILLFWAAKGVDAFRCDMAEMVPLEFWQWAIAEVKRRHPATRFIAEVYQPALYRSHTDAGFDCLYDKVGMYDALCDVLCHRRTVQAITQAWQQADACGVLPSMLYFLENHDECRLASDYLAGSGERALPALAVATLLGTNPLMVYSGQEWGEHGMDSEGYSGRDGRTTIFDYWSLASTAATAPCATVGPAQGARTMPLPQLYARLLTLAATEPAAACGLTHDLAYANPHLERQYAFLRRHGSDLLLVAANFDDAAAHCHITLPGHAFGHLQLRPCTAAAVCLLSGASLDLCLQPNAPVDIDLPPRGATVLKMTVEKG